MVRLRTIERIVDRLQMLSDEALQDLLTELESDITDETLEAITYGDNDTEHLLSHPSNAEDLQQTLHELNEQNLLIPETEHAV